MDKKEVISYTRFLQLRGTLSNPASYTDYWEYLGLVRMQESLYREFKITTWEFRKIGEMIRSPDLGNWEVAKAIMEAKTNQDEFKKKETLEGG